MVDNSVPTKQFHEYQRPEAIPHSEMKRGGRRIEKMRDFARQRPGAILGGLAALVIGAGLLRRR